ncbi:winged helix-turn-helix domain-containing protein [Psychrobium sp. 1_MG-2023]|uniref:winged helix-turn-helix domain-containing protein n=1 Tax=Psychrobium sp. 1_MG-2023 TaxID=3062624 RepID=UPI000C34CA8F|nr:winged helix-turn-helix domain-containing protein [Psychrobium sp. 1_MG-2023]MDP2562927.1 winged helix-turn-helix domain-containing protein [Psychrobium sp. 1_MG-2023]PKF54696.1 DNA-binding response regulator [Alteromonadales bacterium alter-6D02]
MEEQAKPHILLVEDDVALAEWVVDYLQARDFKMTHTTRGDEAVNLIAQLNPDLVLLDGMLPGLDGIDVCKAVRPQFTNPIIMITARDEEIDEVLGLEMGADDYMTKPVRARALLARIRGALRRSERMQQPATVNDESSAEIDRLQFSGLVISLQSRTVSLDGEVIKLSSNEFDVLWFLASKAGEVVSREELVSHLRGFDYDGFDRSIDLRISRLRKKLNDNSAEPFRIKTIWGKGYLLAKDVW